MNYRLKAGWSVKTATSGYQSAPQAIGAEEQATIVAVIKRAEQIDRIEQERVR